MNRLLIPATILSLCLWNTGCHHNDKTSSTEPAGHHKSWPHSMSRPWNKRWWCPSFERACWLVATSRWLLASSKRCKPANS